MAGGPAGQKAPPQVQLHLQPSSHAGDGRQPEQDQRTAHPAGQVGELHPTLLGKTVNMNAACRIVCMNAQRAVYAIPPSSRMNVLLSQVVLSRSNIEGGQQVMESVPLNKTDV